MADNLESRLKRRFRDFLAIKRANDPNAAVRSSIREVLDRIVERGWRSYIVGGTLRDVMLAPPSAFPRDIDLVLVGPSQASMEDAFADLIARKTRFGGLHLVKPFGVINRARGEVLFDVWRLEDTWGIRAQALSPTIESFVCTPFLNIDSVAIEVCPAKTYRKVTENGFFQSLSTRTLEINNKPNPFPLVCIVRALIMAAKLKFSLAPSLAQFVLGYTQWGSIDDLVAAQISHYGHVRCEAGELRRWLEGIGAMLKAGRDRIEVDTDGRMDLWQDWPPIAREQTTISTGMTPQRVGLGTSTRRISRAKLPIQGDLSFVEKKQPPLTTNRRA